MKNSRIVHLMPSEKFISGFIDFVEQNFVMDDHCFLIFCDKAEYPIKARENVHEYKSISKGIPSILMTILKAEKIILHSLFDARVVLILFLCPWVLKKCYWIVWGKDLYAYKLDNRDLKWKVKEFFKKPVIKNFGYLVTYLKGDYNLACQWYGVKGGYKECLMYPSNTFRNICVSNNQHNSVNILIGNSADPSNNHLEIFKNIKTIKDRRVKIFVPLSYEGDASYITKIINAGQSTFGDDFIPLTEFMPFDKYLDMLSGIDIAIFNHKRQQAMGNIITLLGLGKKVYIRSDITPWSMFKDYGVKVFDVGNLELTSIDDAVKKNNKDRVKKYFSEEVLVSQWKNILEEKI